MKEDNNAIDFSAEFGIIADLEKMLSKQVPVFENDKYIAEGTWLKEENTLSLRLPVRFKKEHLENVIIKTDSGSRILTTLDAYKTETKVTNTSFSTATLCSVEYLKNKEFPPHFVSKFRCFIPADCSHMQTYRFQLETIRYSEAEMTYNHQCVRVNIRNHRFDVLQVKSRENGYYIIDSFQDMAFEDFSHYCHAIRQALGFSLGYMPGGEIYYFSFNKDFYYTNYTTPAMKAIYYPIHTNPYSLDNVPRTIANDYLPKLTTLPAHCFSNLVSRIYSDERFSSIIKMIIESESVRSLLLIPSIYAIILEALSKIISLPLSEERKPVKNTKLFQRVVKAMENTIDSFSTELESGDDSQKLKTRIYELNRPIKSMSNMEKLLLPFEQLNIELTQEDRAMIEHRNDLLHGNTHLADHNRTEPYEINNYLMYASAKLYTIISSLILKHIGYTGYIINTFNYPNFSSVTGQSNRSGTTCESHV